MRWRRLTSLVRGGQLDRELNGEVGFHIDMETEKYVQQGMNPEDARTRALRNSDPWKSTRKKRARRAASAGSTSCGRT
ncbi:MAG: permease prefix domain 1-containing protein [Acidobacteria bacterium]|nr:permease prefix domain 1-containing protein [Acidobacteriota bacterium]